MVRDRSAEFHELRQTKSDDVDFAPLLPSDNDDNEDMGNNLLKHRPPCLSQKRWINLQKFLEDVDKFQKDTRLLESYVQDLKMKHSQILITPHMDEKLNLDLNRIVTAFTQLSTKLRSILRDMESETKKLDEIIRKENHEKHQYLMDIRIRSSHQASLSCSIQTVVNNFYLEQQKYRDKCKSKIIGYLSITGRKVSEDELEEAIEEGSVNQLASGILIDCRKSKQILMDLEARNEDIAKLEMSVTEIASLFKDLANLVYSQGEKVDRIENHVFQSAYYIKHGEKITKEASLFKDKYRKKKICVAIYCGSTLVILLCIIVLYFHFSAKE